EVKEDILTPLNILEELKLEQALKLANKKLKDGLREDAKKIYQDILQKFPKNKRALNGVKKLTGITLNRSDMEEPPGDQLKSLVNLYTKKQYREASNKGSQLLEQFPNSINIYNIIGAANKGLGKLENAVEAYNKALSIKPDYADAYYNMGNALKEQGKLDEAIEAYTKAISLKPDYADAYYNMGIALREQGKLEEAMQAYTEVLSLKPDYAEAYYSMGNTLQEQGKIDKAIEAYDKALFIKPDFAEAHRNLSVIKKYIRDDGHIFQVQKLYRQQDLSEDARCKLSFTLSKMHEDIGDLGKSFTYLSEGNALRKKLLNYSFEQDKRLFSSLKKSQPRLSKNSLKIKEDLSELSPIFILGMPRSGTTLVEQIISAHSRITGAGELNYIKQFGFKIATEPTSINTGAVSKFRQKYLSELTKMSSGKRFVTDKMPQNFRFIPLICAALPEAKIIHVQRNADATCWSNYKHYFATKHLRYCYDLNDVVEYYNLYKDLMQHWQSEYSDRLYNLSYENLITDQENQTRKLIKHLGLHWEEACLSPQKNKRIVRTASQQQVRQKVYKGSSEAWRKYEPFLNGAFDDLK
ncbi:tetratricopeptide repeat protein, partial [Paracoccaceae bacterium]|nr:tetratricopeptide repeat protein [Paracoccaceae bacterium]